MLQHSLVLPIPGDRREYSTPLFLELEASLLKPKAKVFKFPHFWIKKKKIISSAYIGSAYIKVHDHEWHTELQLRPDHGRSEENQQLPYKH